MDVVHLAEQAANMLRSANKCRFPAVLAETPGQTLQQPCSERVQLLDAREVNCETAC